MPNTGNSSVDAGKAIKPLDQSVLTSLTSFKGALELASSAAGVSALAVALCALRERAGETVKNAGTVGKPDETALLGEAALKEAFAELGCTHAGSSANGSRTAADHTQTQAEPPPKTVAQVLGEITWLMTQSPRHKAIPLGDLEWLLMPAILLRQFRIFYQGEQPVGVALWALADHLVAKRIDAGEQRLAAVEWKSGSNMRIIDIVAPFGGEAEMRGQVGSL